MVKIDRSQVLNSAKWSSKGKNHKTVIVIHETANESRGAGAYAHHRLQYNGNSRQASWHYTVDDTVAVQSFSENLRLWHSGSVAIPYTIAIEICVNSDSNYNQAVQNAVDLAVDIAKRNNITTNNIVTHKFYTGKNCPTRMLSGRSGWTYNKFINAIEKGLSGTPQASPSSPKADPPKQPSKTNKSIETLAREVIDGKHGHGKDRMKALGNNYQKVQNRVNEILTGKETKPKETNRDIVNRLTKETLAGVHGNGSERKRKLGKYY